MKKTVLVLLILSACGSQSPYMKNMSAPEKCHLLLDTLCERKARCGDDAGYFSRLETCVEYMDRRPSPRKPSPREKCSEIKHVGPYFDACIEGLQDSCQMPETCQHLGGLGK